MSSKSLKQIRHFDHFLVLHLSMYWLFVLLSVAAKYNFSGLNLPSTITNTVSIHRRNSSEFTVRSHMVARKAEKVQFGLRGTVFVCHFIVTDVVVRSVVLPTNNLHFTILPFVQVLFSSIPKI